MKRKIFIGIAVLFGILSLHAQKKYEMVIQQTDGMQTVINTSKIQQIYFQEVAEENSLPSNATLLSMTDFDSYNGSVGVTQNTDGTVTLNFYSGWGWVSIWYGDIDWSSYNELVIELSEPPYVQVKGVIEYNNTTYTSEGWLNYGESAIHISIDDNYSNHTKQIALQTEYSCTLTVKRIYLLKKTDANGEVANVVGTWNIVSSSMKRYENDMLVSEKSEDLTAPYDRIMFSENGTVEYLEYSSSNGTYHEDGKGTYSMDGTRFVYGSGEFDYFEILSYTENEMEVGYQFSEDKVSTIVRKVYHSKLQRTTEVTPRDDEPTTSYKIVFDWNDEGKRESYNANGLILQDFSREVQVDYNNVYFGTSTSYQNFTSRLKSGGRMSATLTVPKAGTLRIAVRTASNSAYDRSLVLTQNGNELFNQIIKENESTDYQTTIINGEEKKVYPYVNVAVQAGVVNITTTAGLNFYCFELLTSDSGDDPMPTGTFKGARALYGDVLVKQITHDERTTKLTYDSNGYLTKVEAVKAGKGTETANLTYTDGKINVDWARDYGSSKDSPVSSEATIGTNGFVRKFVYKQYNGETETCEFEYNSDGQVTKVKWDDDEEVTEFSYSDGDIVSSSTYQNGVLYGTSSMSYTYYVNKAYANSADEADLDDLGSILGFAGALGRPSKHLPARQVGTNHKSGSTSTVSYGWTMNSNGYPTKLDYTEGDDTTTSTITYTDGSGYSDDGGTGDNPGDDPTPSGTGTYQGPQRIFGNVLLNSIYNETDDITETYTYDSNGYPLLIKSTSASRNRNWTIKLSLSENPVIASVYDGDNLMTQYVGTIGSMGYITKLEFVDDKGNPEVIYLTYNEDGQLSTIQWGADDITYLTYSDGDVIRVSGSDGTWDVAYETATQSKQLNTGSFMLWDEMLGIDLDDLESLHWLGLLGKATKHLPLSYVKYGSSSTKYYSNIYEKDSYGRVTKWHKTTKNVYSDNSESTYDSDILRITWNY